MQPLEIAAPAKVNLFLELCGRDEDGYHRLETVFQAIDLQDRLRLSPASPGIGLTVSGPLAAGVPSDRRNLAWRAAESWHRAVGRKAALHIGLEKHVPAAAGLGGGSSDAAAVLRGLQTMSDEPLPADALLDLARELGADVPFFLHGGCAYADGRGDRIAPIAALPPLELTIMQPACDCPTGAVFAALRDEERDHRPRGRDLLTELRRRAPGELLFNRLSAAARRLRPLLAELLDRLAAAGRPHCLSGSGSCCLVLGHVQAPTGTRCWRVRSLEA